MNTLDLAVSELSTSWGIMKYLEKSFTLPASNRPMTQEQWDRIWDLVSDDEVLTKLAAKGLRFNYEAMLQDKPPATESENPIADTVANGGYCPNCHCQPGSYRHIETCVTPGESD